MGNTFKTAFLLTLLTLLLMFIGRAFGGQNGMLLALAFAAVMNFISYFYSDKIALAMYRASLSRGRNCRVPTPPLNASRKKLASPCPRFT